MALALALGSQAAIAQVKIGVIASATGPTAVVGIPQKNTAALLPKTIGDLSVEYVVLDDASDPTQSVLAVRKLLAETGYTDNEIATLAAAGVVAGP